jgi:hypothetical protein
MLQAGRVEDISELRRLGSRQSSDPLLREFLLAQLEWERHHVSRLRLVHALAGWGVCLWLLLAIAPGLPDPLHLAVLGAWAVCFLATGFAGMMEHRWSRRRGHLTAMLGLEENEREPGRERAAREHPRGHAAGDARAHRR